MRLTGSILVKNGAMYIPTLIHQMCRICDDVVILDDGSTDNTYETCKRFTTVTVQTQSLPFNEGRSRQTLLSMVNATKPDWVLYLDHDELLEASAETKLRACIEYADKTFGTEVEAFSFKAFTFWNSYKTYRTDAPWEPKAFIRVYRWMPGLKIREDLIHAPCIPMRILSRGKVLEAPFRLKHFGYVDREERERKYNFYTNLDKEKNKIAIGGEDYSHLVQKDSEIKLNTWED